MSTKQTFPTVAAALMVIMLSLATNCFAQTNLVTPAQYLASQPKPVFAPNNHMPVLGQWGGGGNRSNVCMTLAADWGYAVYLDYYSDMNELTNNLFKAGTDDNGKLLAVSNNPSKYKLQIRIDRWFPCMTNSPAPKDYWVTNASGNYVDNLSNTWVDILYTNCNSSGTYGYWVCATNPNAGFPKYNLVCCPESPDSYWSNAANYWIWELKVIQSNAPISLILNGGEYGLNSLEWNYGAVQLDPRVQDQGPFTNPFTALTNKYLIVNTNGMSWPQYMTDRKARELGFLTTAIEQNFPNRQLYIFYTTDNERGRGYNTNSLNMQYWSDIWGDWKSDSMNTNTDEPSFEFYYGGVQYWTNVPTGDFLTAYLNQIGYNFKLGYSNSYCWVDGGDAPDGNQYSTNLNVFSDIPRYMGFLKCLYMGGMNGAVGCNFSATPTNPPGWGGSFPSNSPPNWLQQLITLSQVHALFSQLETFIDNSDLISGPQCHARSTDQPAYEFTNTVGRVWQDRVMARKIRGTNEWLICAWAADAVKTNITVTIMNLGSVTVLARDSGAIYLASSTNMFIYPGGTTNLLSVETPPPDNFRRLAGGP